jgi:hypothetical protein
MGIVSLIYKGTVPNCGAAMRIIALIDDFDFCGLF